MSLEGIHNMRMTITQLRSRLSPEKVNPIQIVRSAQLAGLLGSESPTA